MRHFLITPTILALLLTLASSAQESFLQRDADGNGRLTISESGLSEEEFKQLDESKNGEISLGEFEDYWIRVTTKPDLNGASYGQDSTRQVLDLYLPSQTEAKVPLLLWIHGGSWKEGSKDACPFQTMTQNGIAVASLNYRFTDETRFPGQLTDCEKAIDFLNKEAETRGFQFGPVTACGLSAGGQLSLMLAGTGSVDNAIAFGAPVDLTPEEAREGYRETLERLVGAPLELEKLKAASPIHNLAGSSARYILIHGTEDRTIPYQQAIQMTQALAQESLSVELVLVPRGSHTVVGGPRIWDRIVALLVSEL